MKNNTKNSVYRKISARDIIIIILTIVALVALIALVAVSKKKDADKQNELSSIGESLEDKEIFRVDEALGDLLINEVNSSGWIEFYNAGTDLMDLSGITIYINGELRHTIPEATTLQVNDYHVIEFVSGIGLNEEDVISVYNKSNQCIINLIVPKLSDGESYGRTKDGDSAMVVLKPTKGATNNGSEILTREEMYFSVPGGFYYSAISLDFIAPEGTEVYYTLDGTTPTTESELYTQAVKIANRTGQGYTYAATQGISLGNTYLPSSISMGTVVKAIAVYPDGTTSSVMTETYFVGVGFGNDYANIPVISLSISPEDMFGYFDGIYVAGRKYEDSVAMGVEADANFLQDWERTAHIEYYEPNKYKTYEGDISISVIQDFSVAAAQKSLLFTSKDELVLKDSTLGNYLNSVTPYFSLSTYSRDNNYKIREHIINALLSDTSVGTKEINPCILFINGEYWGGYILENTVDDKYIKEKYDIDEEIVWISDGAIYGDDNDKNEFLELIEFIVTNDMSVAENYKRVEEKLDIQSYLDYLCANMYLANADYGIESYTLWKTKKATGTGYNDGKWRFMLGEMDNTLFNGTVGYSTTPSIDTFLLPAVQNDFILKALLNNDSFKKQLDETMDNMINNIFSAENVEAAITNSTNLMEKMAISSYKRFIGTTDGNYFSDEVKKIEYFFENRGEYIRLYADELIENGIQESEEEIKEE